MRTTVRCARHSAVCEADGAEWRKAADGQKEPDGVYSLCGGGAVPDLLHHTGFAASDPLAVVSNLSDFIFGLIRAVGLILLGLGVVQVGLSFQSHDPSQRSQGFLTLAGGLVITFVKEVFLLQADKRAYPIGGYALHKTKTH